MIEIKDKLVEKLKEYDIKIFDEFKSGKEDVIMAEHCVIGCEKNEVFINFHIGSSSAFAARIILILKEIKEIKKFFIGDDFIFDDDGKFLEDEEAVKYHQKTIAKEIIDGFVASRTSVNMLLSSECYNC